MHWKWRSANGKFGVAIEQQHVRRIVRRCTAAGDHETGGVLIGHYAHGSDLAIVTGTTGAPRDSQAGRAFFVRGILGLQNHLDRLWRRGAGCYLGEWHCHPEGNGDPSSIDVDQMHQTAGSPDYRCPEPILLIVCPSTEGKWTIRAFVYPLGRQVELGRILTPQRLGSFPERA